MKLEAKEKERVSRRALKIRRKIHITTEAARSEK
jgi:hypothetical protein